MKKLKNKKITLVKNSKIDLSERKFYLLLLGTDYTLEETIYTWQFRSFISLFEPLYFKCLPVLGTILMKSNKSLFRLFVVFTS